MFKNERASPHPAYHPKFDIPVQTRDRSPLPKSHQRLIDTYTRQCASCAHTYLIQGPTLRLQINLDNLFNIDLICYNIFNSLTPVYNWLSDLSLPLRNKCTTHRSALFIPFPYIYSFLTPPLSNTRFFPSQDGTGPKPIQSYTPASNANERYSVSKNTMSHQSPNSLFQESRI